MPHLIVSISGHGFGHVAQTAPVLNALYQERPNLQITVRSAVPLTHLRSRINAPFNHIESHGDIGMVMSSALDVRPAESRATYHQFHENWAERVAEEASLLRELKADFVLSNVGYLPLAGAQQAGIANAALCSLNWSDIYQYYCGTPQAHSPIKNNELDQKIIAQIYACYANSDAFLRATPGMAMNTLNNLIPIAPIAELGRNRGEELKCHLNLPLQHKLVLVSMGGIATRLPIQNWPRITGVKYLVQRSWHITHPDTVDIESLPMSFNDLLASSDALLCKPGYGSFVEATYSGVPILYVSRADWPESEALVTWLQEHGTSLEISREQLESGNLTDAFSELWTMPNKQLTPPNGATQIAQWLTQRINHSSN